MGGLVKKSVAKVVPGDWTGGEGAGKKRKKMTPYKASDEERRKRDQRLSQLPARAVPLGTTILDETLG